VKVNPIIRFAVERRVTMAMAVLGVLVLGWLSLDRLPLEFLPTFSSSFISVDAPYPSSSPAETERLIVRPLEDSLSTINGIESLTAVSTASSGNVSIRFVDGTDMDLAAVDVRDRVDRVRHRLPDDLEQIRIRRFQSSNRPVLRFHVSADWPRESLYRFTEDVIVRRLQRLEGVADVQVSGDETSEIQVNLIPDRMASLGIDVRNVASVIRSNHQSVSAGTVRVGSQSFLFRVEGKLASLDEIQALPLGGGLRLGDVAEVVMDYPEQEEWDFLNGQEALSVYLYKASTANLLAMIDGAKAEITAIQELPEADGLQINIYRDDSEDVRNGLKELRNTGLLGGTLAILFMYLFLRRLRSTVPVPPGGVDRPDPQHHVADGSHAVDRHAGRQLHRRHRVDLPSPRGSRRGRAHGDPVRSLRGNPADCRLDVDHGVRLPADGLSFLRRPIRHLHEQHRAHGGGCDGGVAGGGGDRRADGGGASAARRAGP